MPVSQALRLRLISPPGASALAIIELAGTDAATFLKGLGLKGLSQHSNPRVSLRAGSMRLVSLDLGDGLREQALLVATVKGYEIQIHGNPLLVDAILALGENAATEAVVPGASEAKASETWEERILRLAREAPARHGLRLVLFQLGEQGLCGLLRRIACGTVVGNPAGHSGGHHTGGHGGHTVEESLRGCENALDLAPSAAASLRTHRIVLRGRVNVGKSTLFNLLLGKERVRTGPMPALTRDPVEEEILYRDCALTIVDTAGQSECQSEGLPDLDQQAGLLASQEGKRADLVLWLYSGKDDEIHPGELHPGERHPGDETPGCQTKVLVLETHHPEPKLAALQLDLLQMDRRLLRSHLLDLVLTRLGLDERLPLVPVPLDESMAEDLRWLLDQPDPVAAARKLLG